MPPSIPFLSSFIKPQPHILDIRSLLLFRFLLGLHLCFDVVTRILPYPLSIEWYTSSSQSDSSDDDNSKSLLAFGDSPHGNVIHKIWFARTSAELQYMLFGLTFVLGLLFSFGKLTSPVGRLVLWLLVVSMQHRNMHSHDGSDNFTRQMLMWYCLLPQYVHDSSFIEAIQGGKNKNEKKKSSSLMQICSVACLGLTLQITLMYCGTIAKRIYDPHLIDVKMNDKSIGKQYMYLETTDWKPPDLSAVHYVLRDSFAIRDNWIVQWMRTQNFKLTQGMTAHTMFAEMSSVFWFLCPNSHIRYWGFWILGTLHFGLLLVTRLPNWQFIAMIASILWIPSCVWNENDDDDDKTGVADNAAATAASKTTTDDDTKKKEEEEEKEKTVHSNDATAATTKAAATSTQSPKPSLGSRLRQLVVWFLLGHMIYNFSAQRRWIPKYDDGDIGEFFRISQFWVMYGTVPRHCITTNIIGYRTRDEQQEWIDVLKAIETNDWSSWKSDSSYAEYIHRPEQSIVSPRWERAIHQWSNKNDKKRIRTFARSLCNHLSSTHDVERLQYFILGHKIVDPPPHRSEFDTEPMVTTNIPRWESRIESSNSDTITIDCTST